MAPGRSQDLQIPVECGESPSICPVLVAADAGECSFREGCHSIQSIPLAENITTGRQLECEVRYGDNSSLALSDFRELLAREDVDATYIGTPDHWHAPMAIAAARAGKHIYGQEPYRSRRAAGVPWLMPSRPPAWSCRRAASSARTATSGRVARGNLTPRAPPNDTCTSPRMWLLSTDARRSPGRRPTGCMRDRGPPDSGCPSLPHWLRWPLRSGPITGPPSLLLGTPSLCAALVLNRSRFCRLRVSLVISATGSHVPHKSPDRVPAAFMPDADRAVNRHPPT